MLTFWQNYSHVRFQDFVGHSKDPFVKAKVEWGLRTSGMLRGISWGNLRWDWYVLPKRRQPTTNLRRVTSQKREGLI